MNTRSRRSTHRSECGSSPRLTARPRPVTTPAAQAALAIAESPGAVVGSVCSGYGGLDLGVLAALGGGRLAWCADPDPHIAQILAVRLLGVPNLGDVRAIDWARVEPVEVLTAGFPCQDISAAGRRRGIENGTRSGLWTDIVAGVRILRPALVVENVAALRWRHGGLHRVLGDLAEAGYDALWRSVRAADIGAPHRRERVFLLAWPRACTRPSGGGHDRDAADADRTRRLVQRHRGSRPARRSRGAGPAAAVAHADRLGREGLHTPDADGWAVAARPGPVAADAAGIRHSGPPCRCRLPATAVATGASTSPAHAPRAVADLVADATGDRRHEGLPGATRLQGRPDVALGGHTPDPGRQRQHLVVRTRQSEVDWGVYSPAVRHWEQVLGRGAPFPTQPGRHGRPVLAPAFVEWLRGLEPGWVTALPLPRTAQLRALGNGVVPQQATHAVELLLAELAVLLAADARATGRCVSHEREANAA